MSDQDYVLGKIREAFKSAFDADPQSVSIDTTASDIPAWDSVGHLSLAGNLEEVFGISLDVDGKNPLPPGTTNPITLGIGLNDKISS